MRVRKYTPTIAVQNNTEMTTETYVIGGIVLAILGSGLAAKAFFKRVADDAIDAEPDEADEEAAVSGHKRIADLANLLTEEIQKNVKLEQRCKDLTAMIEERDQKVEEICDDRDNWIRVVGDRDKQILSLMADAKAWKDVSESLSKLNNDLSKEIKSLERDIKIERDLKERYFGELNRAQDAFEEMRLAYGKQKEEHARVLKEMKDRLQKKEFSVSKPVEMFYRVWWPEMPELNNKIGKMVAVNSSGCSVVQTKAGDRYMVPHDKLVPYTGIKQMN